MDIDSIMLERLKMREVDFDDKEFLQVIDEFLRQCDKCVQNSYSTKGITPAKLKKELNVILADFGYVSHIGFGVRKLSKKPSMCFAPRNILDKNLVNGEKLQLNRGVYIWLGYNINKACLCLCIAYSNACKNLSFKAINLIKEKRAIEVKNGVKEWEYYYARSEYKEKLVKDFLHLISEFNQFAINDFKSF